MKKQTLFDLASMPKMVLVITLIVMPGLLFGAISYLLKTPKTDLPIINPVVETQCEVDSDCSLVYVGGACTACSTFDEEYQCLPWKEAAKIEEERQRILNDPEGPQCSLCMPLFEIQHTCKCENGKCEKVKKELVEEVIITTDKTEYEQGEMVKITIKNNSGEEQGMGYPPYVIEKFENNDWETIRQLWCPCDDDVLCSPHNSQLGKSREYNWFQMESWCSDSTAISNQVPAGKYRIKFLVSETNSYIDLRDVYSNEFTIKEKSALDARCEEKVIGIGLCEALGIGYEFNSETGECIKRGVSGCSFEIPFETLEECQEVCEEKIVCGWCGLRCVEYPISEDDCKTANGIFDKQCACPEVIPPHKIFFCSEENGKCVSKPIYTLH